MSKYQGGVKILVCSRVRPGFITTQTIRIANTPSTTFWNSKKKEDKEGRFRIRRRSYSKRICVCEYMYVCISMYTCVYFLSLIYNSTILYYIIRIVISSKSVLSCEPNISSSNLDCLFCIVQVFIEIRSSFTLFPVLFLCRCRDDLKVSSLSNVRTEAINVLLTSVTVSSVDST